jgi:hypothetical protein
LATLIIGHVGSPGMTPCITPNLGYYVNRDFTAVSLLAKVPNISWCTSVPVKDLREFLALARRNWPARITARGQRQRRPPGHGIRKLPPVSISSMCRTKAPGRT